ncbi:hypothetical protein AZE42_08404 [Rhizopogon vesiculosus]|uniref:Nucleoside transporter n=1 Tax=Rhizopogon vesiculosus TaxID=180088 RepID=A0A1J8QXP8_9AGAM|nr:hypothetical protein AZE42_08404 [Rhizopogon vesiculosus]
MDIRTTATGSDMGVAVYPISTEEVGQDVDDETVLVTLVSHSQDVHGDTRIRWVYFMLGAATLLSWNALINANPFFISRLSGSPWKAPFSSYLSSDYTASNLIALGYAIVTSKQSSPSRRGFWSTALTFAIVAALFMTTFIHPSPTPFFYFIMISTFCMSGAAAYLSNSVFAGAALFGAPYMQSMMSGQAAVAVAVSSVQVISSAISVWGTTPLAPAISDTDRDGKAEEASARIFFAVSALYMIATLLAYRWLASLQVYRTTMGALEDNLKARVALDEADERQALLPPALPSPAEGSQILRVLKTNFIYNFAVGYVFTVTLAVYPAITVSIKPTNPTTHPLLFSAVHFLMFSSARRILALALFRTLFIPAFLLCNVEHPFPVTPFINSDVVYMLLLCALGISNGYVSTLCMLGAPSLEHNRRLRGRQEDVDVAGTIAGFCLIVGLTAGGFGSFGVRAVIYTLLVRVIFIRGRSMVGLAAGASKWMTQDLLGSEATRISPEQHSSGSVPLRSLKLHTHTDHAMKPSIMPAHISTIESGVVYHALPAVPHDDDLDSEIAVDDFETDDSVTLTDQPVDTRIQWVYFMLGCAVLLPWNGAFMTPICDVLLHRKLLLVLITATSFFLSRLVGSPLRATFSSYLSTVYTVFHAFGLAHATVTSGRSSPSQRVFWSTASVTLLIALLFVSTFVDSRPTTFFFFAIICSIFLAGCISYLATAAFSGASLFGAPYIQSMLSGQAAIAVVVSTVQLATSVLSVWGSTPEEIAAFVSNDSAGDESAERDSARGFFGISALFMISTFMAYAWLARLPAYKATVGILERNVKLYEALGSAGEAEGLVFCSANRESLEERNQIFRVFKANIIYEIAVAYVYVVTLSVFPVITITVQSTNPNIHPLIFSAIHFLMFNLGDLCGRYICSFPRIMTWSAQRALAFSILRTLFIPVFLLCNVQRPSGGLSVIRSDFVYMLLVTALGLSNGYVSTLCMLGVSSLEHNPRLRQRREDVATASTVAGFCLMVGLAIGGFGSFGVRAAICECNPFKE